MTTFRAEQVSGALGGARTTVQGRSGTVHVDASEVDLPPLPRLPAIRHRWLRRDVGRGQ